MILNYGGNISKFFYNNNNNNNKDISGATSRLIQIFSLFERALALLPGSYKLWNTYIEMRIEKFRHVRVTSPAYNK